MNEYLSLMAFRGITSILSGGLLIFLVIIVTSCSQNRQVSLTSLLNEQIDKGTLTYFPDPPYHLKQSSSFDRRSESDPEQWFANRDYTHFASEEIANGRREFVLMDHEGPGAIVRWWMTFAGEGSSKGIVRVYLDGLTNPVIEDSILHVLSGNSLVEYPLSASVSTLTDYDKRGHNLYLPIPFAKSCKVTYESPSIIINDSTRKPSVYYNINFRAYDKNTEVISFSRKELESNQDLVEKVNKRLQFGMKQDEGQAKLALAAGESTTLFENEGPAAISLLSITLPDSSLSTLRSLVLEMKFDELKTVEVPLGDFFDTGYILREVDAYFTNVHSFKLQSEWMMPFQKTASIGIKNYGSEEVVISSSVEMVAYTWKANSMYFGASWHEYSKIVPAGILNPGDGKVIDLDFVEIHGKGLYVADNIVLYNSDDAWWGEGDEKIFVDGEVFPSSFGTGTEDYYGYAWARPERFSHPFIGQPDGSGNFFPGYTVNIRQRALDAIPFRSKIDVNMELLHWVSTPMDYAITTKYYVMPDFELTSHIKRFGAKPSIDRFDLIDERGKGMKWEGEQMRILGRTGGNTTTQYIPSFNWSNKGQLWWTDAEAGDTLALGFTTGMRTRADVEIGLSKASDYGQCDIFLNSRKVGSWDGYAPDTVYSEVLYLAGQSIQEGSNELSIVLTGANAQAKDGMMVGVDFVRIKE